MLPAMDPRQQLTWIGARLAADALSSHHAIDAEYDAPAAAATQTAFRAGGLDGVVAVSPLFPIEADGETMRRKAELEERLHAYGARDLVLWAPPGARLPDDADATAGQVVAAASELPEGGRGEVAFAVKVGIRKTGADGSYMSVLGGLSHHWAKFTTQVMGEYQLDSTAIHRLPEDPEKITQLVDFLVLVANGLRKAGATTTVNSEDVWTIQRIPGLEEPIVVAAAPDAMVDGRAVRRLMRRGLREAGAEIDPGAQVRVHVLVGLVSQLETETATIALRGMDAMLVGGWDFIGLGADGQLRPLLGPAPPLV